jgi:hypothetical protein
VYLSENFEGCTPTDMNKHELGRLVCDPLVVYYLNLTKGPWKYAYVGIAIDLNVGDIRHPTLTSAIPISDIEEKKYFSQQIRTHVHWDGKRAL